MAKTEKMNDLQKMKQSCELFAKDLKTGGVVWSDMQYLKLATCDFLTEVLNAVEKYRASIGLRRIKFFKK